MAHKKTFRTSPPVQRDLRPARLPGDPKVEIAYLREQIVDLVGQEPIKAAKILTNWLDAAAAASSRKKAG